MNRFLLAALVAFPIAASAQQTPSPTVGGIALPQKKPEMALIPRDVVSTVMSLANAYAALHPEFVTPTTQAAFTALDACLKVNSPIKTEPDPCPTVTAAIEDRTKEVADLTAKIAELNASKLKTQVNKPPG